MKKTLIFLVLFLFFLFSFDACSSDNLNDSRLPLNELESTTNPVESMTNDESSISLENVTSVSAKITSGFYYVYEDEPVKISHAYSVDGGVQSFGLIVLCDGIATPFSTNWEDEEKILQVIPNADGEIVNTDLYFTPIGTEGESVSVEIVDIIEPDFDISTLNLNADDLNVGLQPIIIGGRLNIASLGGITIEMKVDGISNTATISEQYETSDIPQDIIESNKTINDDGTVDNQLTSFKTDLQNFSKLYRAEKGDILPFDMKLSGTEGQDICVSFFLNNNIYPIFDKCDYVRCHVDNTHYTEVHGELDTSDLESGIYICYAICGSIEYNNNTAAIPAFILEVT